MKKFILVTALICFNVFQAMETEFQPPKPIRTKARELKKQKTTPQNHEIVLVLNDGSLPINAEELLFLEKYSQTIKNMSEA